MDKKLHIDYLMHRNVNTKHKYIAKIGEGINARYFYTMEALNAYKQALSSKDEKATLDKANAEEAASDKRFDDAAAKRNAVDKEWKESGALKKMTLRKELNEAKREEGKAFLESEEARKKADNAAMDYRNAKTLKGKVEAVKETHADLQKKKTQRKAKTEVENTVNDAKKTVKNKADDVKKTVEQKAKPVTKKADQAADRVKYEGKKQAIEAEYAVKTGVAKARYGEGSKEAVREEAKIYAKYGMNEIMKSLNEVGEGRLDDHVEKTIKKGKKFVDRLSGR